MNVKTTLTLLIVLIVLGGGLWFLSTREAVVPLEDAETTIEPPLLADDFGDVEQVVLQREGQDPWEFKREPAEADSSQTESWMITSPVEATAAKWVIDGIVRRIKNAKVQSTFAIDGDGTVTLKEADLDPPREHIMLTNAKGDTVQVGVGRQASENGTYVRLGDQPNILLASPALKDLLKKDGTEYRDLSAVKFDKANATRLEVTEIADDGTRRDYVLLKSDGKWVFESPFKADADPKAVNDLINAFSNLRVTNWIDPGDLGAAAYGLDPAPIEVTVTVETPVEARESTEAESGNANEAEEPADDEAEAEAQTESYTVLVSRHSPIGEENKVYIRLPDQADVATVSKTTADKFVPKLSAWRDMKLVHAPVKGADTLRISNQTGTFELKREGGAWSFAESGESADTQAVSNLLEALNDLEALNFVDDAKEDSAAYGLQNPQAVVEATMPGRTDLVRLEIGDFTDMQTKRLVFTRLSGTTGVAKVKIDDVEPFTKSAVAFKDRQIVSVAPGSIDTVKLTGPHPATQEPYSITLSNQDDEYVLTAPVEAETDTTKSKALVDALENLRAEEVMPEDQGTLFEDTANTVTVELMLRPEEDASAVDESEESESESSAEARTIVLQFIKKDAHAFATRVDMPTVYRISEDTFATLNEEFHEPSLFAFDESAVENLVFETPGGSSGFEKRGTKWVWLSEPDLPIDPKKVESLAAQVATLKTDRYVAYDAPLARFGLTTDARALTIRVRLDDGTGHVLAVAGEGPDKDPDKRLYAALMPSTDSDETAHVFLLPNDTLDRFTIDPAEYEAEGS